ncbi:MAG TPA: DUF6318 family protein, partial [Nocardioidaceae bacterium]|nr:DUF6318 family protein [Nocardioidaceae bacterium]
SASPTASPPSPTTSDDASAGVTAEPTPSPETAAAKPPKAPKGADTAAGRRAFARFVVGTWGYALRTNDPQPLLELSPKTKSCVGCPQLRSELRKREKQGWYVDFPGTEVEKADLNNAGSTWTARMPVVIPESDSYNEDGTYRSTNRAHPKGSFEVEMRFEKGSYKLVAFRVS